jgi:hypothetical protein
MGAQSTALMRAKKKQLRLVIEPRKMANNMNVAIRFGIIFGAALLASSRR